MAGLRNLIATMYLEGNKCGMAEGPFSNQLMLVRADKTTEHLTVGDRGSNDANAFDGMSLILIDAGDYDGDGKSEQIFFVSGYNRDGYAIFFDSFKKNALWTWSYH